LCKDNVSEEIKEREVATMYKTVIFILIVFGLGNVQGSIVEFNEDWVIHEGDEYDIVSVLNDATVGMTGSEVWEIHAKESSTFNLFDGVAYSVYAENSSSIYIYGGTIDRSLYLSGSSTANLFGGEIAADVVIFDSGRLNVYGYGFEYRPAGGSGWLSGYWLDGTPFNDMYLRILPEPFPGSHVVLIPEPTTLLLLALGGAIIRRRTT
jgi:hypothetical protein